MSVSIDQVRRTLANLDLEGTIDDARQAALLEALIALDAELVSTENGGPRPDRWRELAEVLERLALSADGTEPERRNLLELAFVCRRAVDAEQLTDLNERMVHLVMLGAAGVLAGRTAELAMLLREDVPTSAFAVPPGLEWGTEVQLRAMRAFLLLCRRADGWNDVRAAVDEIEKLRELQREREEEHISQEATSAALSRLIAQYNLARILDLTAQYVITGQPSDALGRIDRHHSNIAELLEFHPDPALEHVADLIRAACRELVRGSVWSDTRRLGSRVRAFVDELARADRDQPILELWPSQRTALGSSLLDPAKRAVVVEMPTSAGKTLVAEFAMVQALALNPDSTVAYVVPTRALVNQITQRLRQDLGQLQFTVEAAVPVFELDPTEETFLRERIHVLVTTPEKLDLLIRQAHPVASEIALVVADEAHNLGDGNRGARLELLLGTLKRERAEARFVLLTPFVPNGRELATWLGDEADATINVNWKPTEAVTAASLWRKPRNQPERLQLRTLPSAQYVDFREELLIDVGRVPIEGNRNHKNVVVSSALRLAERGSVLVLARGPKTAENVSAAVAENRDERTLNDFGTAVRSFAASELGSEHPLIDQLARGVTFHHAGLSHDLRFLIEQLITDEQVDVVAGTTTLAQGVNFPIASVVFETLKKPARRSTWTDLTFSEFWNVAGRAGRALQDRVGLVVFPTTGTGDVDRARVYLQRRAEELASVLLEVVDDIDQLVEGLDLGTIRRQPALAVFLQYLVHALRVAGYEAASSEVEDLLRSSLVYHQLSERDPAGAERVVRAARRYLDTLSDRPRGLLALADGTGFSLASVDMIYARQREEHPEFADHRFWRPDHLFGGDTRPLKEVIQLIADVPELSLGRTEGGPFDPEAVAGIVRDWVHGETVSVIADRWFAHQENADERRRAASRYLYSSLVGQVPWGMGALQRLVLGGQASEEDVGHVPSLVFYGVATKEAAALRMAGVPRIAAEGLGAHFRAAQAQPDSFGEVRTWLSELDDSIWASHAAADSPLTGQQTRLIWEALSGVTSGS